MAAAARSLKSAEDFCEKFGISKPVEGYDKLVELADVDVVYVGVIHNHHLQVIQALILHLARHPHVDNVARRFAQTVNRTFFEKTNR